MQPLLKVENLRKNYGSFEAVKGIDFTIEEGTCLGLLGSNGAGKSSTIRILIGQMQPTSGQVCVLGINPSLEPKKLHSFTGYVPDNQNLYKTLTVEQNVKIFANLYKKGDKEVEEILKKVQLYDRRKTRVSELSRGLTQRVLIARALVHRPKLLFLDEPTTGLDPSFAEVIYLVLEEAKKQGTTILLTTHLMNDVERLSDKIVFMDKGEKIEEGSLFDLKQKYSEPYVEVKIEKNGQIETRRFHKDKDITRELAILQSEGKILSVHTHESGVSDIFVKLGNNKK